jgi:site-specific DNA recombinase
VSTVAMGSELIESIQMNAVVYCRVSTKEQVQNLSLGTQETRCVDFCSRNDWAVINVFRDEGESAKTTDRPAFQKMLTYCKSKQNALNYVVVHDLSRFSRDLADQMFVITELESVGVRLRSVMENVDETSAGKLMRNIHGAFNQFDNDRKAERTKLGMKRAAAMGRFPFKAPLGYLNILSQSQSGTNLIPDPVRAPLVKKAFELYGKGTETKNGVLRTISALGLKTQTEKAVTPQTFERMLRNPIYAGWVVIPEWSLKERGSFAPIVSDEQFRQVQDILDGKRLSVTAHSRNNPDFPLRVFLTCGSCQTPLTGSWSKGRKDRYAYYRCRNANCRAVNIRRDKLEKEFSALLKQLTPERRYMRLFKEIVRNVWRQKQASSEELLRAAKRKIAELGERKNQLVDFLLKGRLDQSTYDEQLFRLNADVLSAEQELVNADMETLDVEAVLEFAERLIENPDHLWIESNLDQKQRLQRVFFPQGLSFTHEGFGTATSNSFFKLLDEFMGKESSLASPTGFEPVLSP